MLAGVVVHGDKRGRVLGFPTANLALEIGALPADGVYCCLVRLGDGIACGGTCSIGTNPTFGDVAETRIEVFIHDFDRTIYGEAVELRLLAKLRDMRRFETVAALIEQTGADVALSRAKLQSALAGSDGCLNEVFDDRGRLRKPF